MAQLVEAPYHKTGGRGFDSLRITVAARFKACISGRSLPGIAGSNPARGLDVFVCSTVKTKDKIQHQLE